MAQTTRTLCPGVRHRIPYLDRYCVQLALLTPCQQCKLQTDDAELATMKPPGFTRGTTGYLQCPARIGPAMPQPYDVTKNYKGGAA